MIFVKNIPISSLVPQANLKEYLLYYICVQYQSIKLIYYMNIKNEKSKSCKVKKNLF